MIDEEYVKKIEERNRILEEENIVVEETKNCNQELKISLTLSLFHLHAIIHNLELYGRYAGTAQVTPDPVRMEKEVWDKFYEKLKIIENCPISQEQALTSRLYSKFAEMVRKRYG